MEIGVLRRDGRTDPFFDGTATDRLVIKHCEPCDRWLAPDASACPDCGDEDPAWVEATGDATLVTWTIVHRPEEPPAYLALVELVEGPWLHTRLDGVDHPALHEGLPLYATFVHPPEGESYVLFSAAAAGRGNAPRPSTGARPRPADRPASPAASPPTSPPPAA